MGFEIESLESVIDTDEKNNNGIIDDNELTLIDEHLSHKESTDEIDKVFNDPKMINALVGQIEQQIKSIKPEKVDGYKKLLSSLQSYVGGINYAAIDGSGRKQKRQQNKSNVSYELLQDNLLGKKNNATDVREGGKIALLFKTIDDKVLNNSVNNKETGEKSPEKSLQSIISRFDDHVLDMLQELQSGKIDLNNINNLSVIPDFISFLDKSTDRSQTIDDFTSQLQKKIDAITDVAQKTKSQALLTALMPMLRDFKDKNSILSITASKLSGSIDAHLNGSPYDKLLTDASDMKNLDTPDSKKALAQIFLRDQGSYDKLMNDFNDPVKKIQSENIIKKYAELEGAIIPEGTTISVKDIVIKDKDDKDIMKKGFELKDKDGNLLKNITFGNKGEPKKFADILGEKGPTWLKGKDKGMFDIVDGKLFLGTALAGELGVEGVAAKLIVGKSFGDAMSAFFNSPMFDELKKMFLMLGMFSKEGISPENQTEIDMISCKKQLRALPDGEYLVKELDTTRRDTGSVDGKNNQNAPGCKRDYFTHYLTLENQKNLLNGLPLVDGQLGYTKDGPWIGDKGKNQTSNASVEKKEPNTDKVDVTDKVNTAKEFVSGQSYPDAKINASSGGKIDFDKTDLANPYLLVDGQVVILTPSIDKKLSTGIMRIQNDQKTGFLESSITITQDNKISIVKSQTPVLIDQINQVNIDKVYKNQKLTLPIPQGSESLFNYFAFSKTVDTTKLNTIDGVYNALSKDPIQLGTFQKKLAEFQMKFNTLSEKSPATISQLITEMKLDTLVLTDKSKQSILTAAIGLWKKMFGDTKEVVNKTPA